jgi:hypothetical protein
MAQRERDSPSAASLSARATRLGILLLAPENFLLPEIRVPGHRPSHEQKCLGVAKRMPDSYALKRYDSATLSDSPADPHSDASNRGIKDYFSVSLHNYSEMSIWGIAGMAGSFKRGTLSL